jgi:hypothetical protein
MNEMVTGTTISANVQMHQMWMDYAFYCGCDLKMIIIPQFLESSTPINRIAHHFIKLIQFEIEA